MDANSLILTTFLLIQMCVCLIMLNPVNDARKINQAFNRLKETTPLLTTFIGLYLYSVVYIGIYLPIKHYHYIHHCEKKHSAQAVLAVTKKLDKDYIKAGFSLFLLVVMIGIKSLITATSSMKNKMDNLERKMPETNSYRANREDRTNTREELLMSPFCHHHPYVLLPKRSISCDSMFQNTGYNFLQWSFKPETAYAVHNL